MTGLSRGAAVFLTALSVAAAAHANVIQLTCGKTRLTIDTAKPAVTVHFDNGFSQTYENGSKTSSYQFLDGTQNPFTSTLSVTVTAKTVTFSNRYETKSGVNLIDNVFNRKTGIWHADQNGRQTDTQCK